MRGAATRVATLVAAPAAGRRGAAALVVATVALLALAPLARAQTPVADAAHDAASVDAVATLLADLADHPARLAADAAAEAAGLRAAAVRQPLTVSLRADAQRLSLDESGLPLPPGVDQTSASYAVTVVFRPFVAGDLADLADQRVVDVERSALQARDARAQLEVQTLRAANGLWLADLAVALAERGEALALAAYAATERRAEVGGATPIELGDADLAVREARAGLRDARAQRDLAAARLGTLVPDPRPLAPLDLEPVDGVPPDLIRASLDVVLAEVAVRNAERGLLPRLEAGYSWRLDGDAMLSLGVDSRTWQPALTYQTPATAAPPNVTGALSVGVAWTLSPQQALETEATRRQLDAAIAGLRSAHDRARLTDRGHEVALAAAHDRELLARLDLDLRALERDAADARLAAGTIGELERLQAHLTWQRSAFALASARIELVNAVLDTYLAYAQPLSEVLP